MRLWGRRQKQQGAGAEQRHLDNASFVGSGINIGRLVAVKGLLGEWDCPFIDGSLPQVLAMGEGRRAQEVRGPRRCTAQAYRGPPRSVATMSQ